MGEHQIPSGTKSFVRITFPLIRDDDEYPPADNETMWAAVGERGTYQLDNIPFYVRGVSFGDIVSADGAEPGPLKFRAVLEPSMHSTLRVFLSEDSSDRHSIKGRTAELRRSLKELGCDTEAICPGFFAVDVPPAVRISSVRAILGPGFEAGLWDYEEATLWHSER